MLETADHQRLTQMLDVLPCHVKLPEAWGNYFETSGFAPSLPDERRGFARMRIRADAVCQLNPTLPAIDRKAALHRVYLFDLSRTGISFISPEQLFPCEEVVVWTSTAKVSAVVRRCVKVCDNGYHIGAQYL